jgi:hypothetical protein
MSATAAGDAPAAAVDAAKTDKAEQAFRSTLNDQFEKVEEQSRRLALIRQELETLEAPTRRDVAEVRARIDETDRKFTKVGRCVCVTRTGRLASRLADWLGRWGLGLRLFGSQASKVTKISEEWLVLWSDAPPPARRGVRVGGEGWLGWCSQVWWLVWCCAVDGARVLVVPAVFKACAMGAAADWTCGDVAGV